MKRSSLFIAVILCIISFAAKSFAQTGKDTVLARIVYTNSDRKSILAKTVGAYKVDTLFTAAGTLQLANLAVLASTKDGQTIMIGGKAVFIDPSNSTPDSAWFIAKISAPFHNTGLIKLPPFYNPGSFGGATILKIVYSDQNNDKFDKILPLGVITPDEQSWFATPIKSSSGGQQWFFHGLFNGTGSVDSIQVTGSASAVPDFPGYHMTNLVTSDDGSTMLCVVFDGIGGVNSRCQVFRWAPGTVGGGFAFTSAVITSQVQSLRPHIAYPDTVFAFSLHTLFGQGNCELSLVPTAKGDINFYTFPVTGSINNLPPSGRTIKRSVLPNGTDGKTLQFFTGFTGNPNAFDDKDVVTPASGYPCGNGGDMMFNPAGDSMVFVTCKSDETATNQESGIYIYDFGSQKATLVQNDTTLMERQPIFAGYVVHKYVPPPPPPYVLGTARIDSTSLSFGVDSIGDPAIPRSFKLTTNNGSLVYITKIQFNGNNAGVFTLLNPNVSNLPITLKGGASQSFALSFLPSAVQSYTATLEIHYNDSLTTLDGKNRPDSIFMIPLSGTGMKKKPTGGVHSSAPSSFDLSIVPNPFSSNTRITVTAREAGSSSLEIRDVLGKEIYSSKSFVLAPSEKYSYLLDANSLHLAPGTYFVIVRSNGEELTRQAIYVK